MTSNVLQWLIHVHIGILVGIKNTSYKYLRNSVDRLHSPQTSLYSSEKDTVLRAILLKAEFLSAALS